jgi:hypothetical protein
VLTINTGIIISTPSIMTLSPARAYVPKEGHAPSLEKFATETTYPEQIPSPKYSWCVDSSVAGDGVTFQKMPANIIEMMGLVMHPDDNVDVALSESSFVVGEHGLLKPVLCGFKNHLVLLLSNTHVCTAAVTGKFIIRVESKGCITEIVTSTVHGLATISNLDGPYTITVTQHQDDDQRHTPWRPNVLENMTEKYVIPGYVTSVYPGKRGHDVVMFISDITHERVCDVCRQGFATHDEWRNHFSDPFTPAVPMASLAMVPTIALLANGEQAWYYCDESKAVAIPKAVDINANIDPVTGVYQRSLTNRSLMDDGLVVSLTDKTRFVTRRHELALLLRSRCIPPPVRRDIRTPSISTTKTVRVTSDRMAARLRPSAVDRLGVPPQHRYGRSDGTRYPVAPTAYAWHGRPPNQHRSNRRPNPY